MRILDWISRGTRPKQPRPISHRPRRPFTHLHLDRLEERLLLSPTITSLSPNSAVEGSNSALLAVIGSGFQTGATVYWNGAALSTTLVSSSELQATIPAIDIAEEESESISVANPD